MEHQQDYVLFDLNGPHQAELAWTSELDPPFAAPVEHSFTRAVAVQSQPLYEHRVPMAYPVEPPHVPTFQLTTPTTMYHQLPPSMNAHIKQENHHQHQQQFNSFAVPVLPVNNNNNNNNNNNMLPTFQFSSVAAPLPSSLMSSCSSSFIDTVEPGHLHEHYLSSRTSTTENSYETDDDENTPADIDSDDNMSRFGGHSDSASLSSSFKFESVPAVAHDNSNSTTTASSNNSVMNATFGDLCFFNFPSMPVLPLAVFPSASTVAPVKQRKNSSKNSSNASAGSVASNARRIRQTRPKVVEAKGSIQCLGKNRKKGTQCRNAALMEYIGPRPQYCAEHIELDPASLYVKCKAGYQKERGDQKACKEVVLREFGLCYKHFPDLLAVPLATNDVQQLSQLALRTAELLTQLEREAAAAKKKDGDLYQRKNKLIPKFQEMKKIAMAACNHNDFVSYVPEFVPDTLVGKPWQEPDNSSEMYSSSPDNMHSYEEDRNVKLAASQ